MAWFLFAGDMLVMLFMTVLVVWLSLRGQASANDFSAHIPLHDDRPAPAFVQGSPQKSRQLSVTPPANGSERHG